MEYISTVLRAEVQYVEIILLNPQSENISVAKQDMNSRNIDEIVQSENKGKKCDF